MEMDVFARQAAIEASLARDVLQFCRRRHVGVVSVTPVVDSSDGETIVGHDLILQGGRKRSHFRTTAHVFGIAVRLVSQNAWDYEGRSDGRRLMYNVAMVARTVDGLHDSGTVYSLASERRTPSVAVHTPTG